MTTRRFTRRRFGLGITSLSAVLVGGCLSDLGGDDDHEQEHKHEHVDPPWEWGGLYDLESGSYSYTYHEGPDSDMRFAVVPAEEGGEHGLFHAGETATDLFEDEDGTVVGAPDVVVVDGDTVEPSPETLYRVDFEAAGETTLELEVGSNDYYAIFTAHVPEEFEAELRSEAGDEVTPETTELHSSHDHARGEGDSEHDHDDDSDHDH